MKTKEIKIQFTVENIELIKEQLKEFDPMLTYTIGEFESKLPEHPTHLLLKYGNNDSILVSLNQWITIKNNTPTILVK